MLSVKNVFVLLVALFAAISVFVHAEDATNAAAADASEKVENLAELVTGRVSFPQGDALVAGKPSIFAVSVKNASSSTVMVTGARFAYAHLPKAQLKPVQQFVAVEAGKETIINFPFVCELNAKAADVSMWLVLLGKSTQTPSIEIPLLTAHKMRITTQESRFDLQSLGIYLMLALASYGAWLWMRASRSSGSSTKKTAAAKSAPVVQTNASTTSVIDAAWIPKRHLNVALGKGTSSSSVGSAGGSKAASASSNTDRAKERDSSAAKPKKQNKN